MVNSLPMISSLSYNSKITEQLRSRFEQQITISLTIFFFSQLTKSLLVFSYMVAIRSHPKCCIHATRARFRADSEGKARKRVGNFFLFDSASDLEAYDIYKEIKSFHNQRLQRVIRTSVIFLLHAAPIIC